MILQRIKKYISKELVYICLLALIIRIISIFQIGNLDMDYYWEYGELAKNVLNGKGYSLLYLNEGKLEASNIGNDTLPLLYLVDKNLEFHYKKDITPFKSAYMPPGYVFFLTPFMAIKNVPVRNVIIKLAHAILSILTIFLLYLLCTKYFSKTTGLIAVFIVSFMPEFIYSVSSFTPTVLFHFFITLLLLIMVKKDMRGTPIIIGVILSLLIYLRSEFLIYALFLLSFYLISKQWNKLFTIFSLICILMIPWSIRNYYVFNKFIPTTTNLGLNLYRGNNSEELGSWGSIEIFKEIESLPQNNNFEVVMDDIYKRKAINFIINNPVAVSKNTILKLFYLWVIYPADNRVFNILYIAPSFFILITFIYGIILSFSISKFKYIYLFFIYSSFISMMFLAMTRHQTMLKICMIPFSAYAIEMLYKKLLFHFRS